MPLNRFAWFRAAAICTALAFLLGAGPGGAIAAPSDHADSGGHAAGHEHQAEAPDTGGALGLLPPASSTEHSITLDGKTLSYRATAGTLPLRNASGKIIARLFYTAYTALPEDHARPLSFVFNGGPGAASAYLNLGAMGPKTLVLNGDGSLPPPPSKLADNPDSWLAFSDLVFVDPVGTGYSLAADPKDAKSFYGVTQDTDAMAAFIRLYLAKAKRATSPIYLVGESYGGFRAAKLAKALPEKSGIALNGVVMVSPALEFSLLSDQSPGPVMSEALTLPSMTAVNLYDHGASTAEALSQQLKPAEHYALDDYLSALAAGPVATQQRAAAKVASLTGLPMDLVKRHYGQISLSLFVKSYPQQPGTQLSRYDGTVSGPDTAPASPYPHGPDPILDRTVPVFTSAFIDYVRGDLGYKTPVTYHLLNLEISGKWDYGLKPNDQGYAGAMDDLEAARALNPDLKVLIASGYTDLVTPYMVPRYLADQVTPLPGAAPIEIKDYVGGHMMYLRADSRHALAKDAAALYGKSGHAKAQ